MIDQIEGALPWEIEQIIQMLSKDKWCSAFWVVNMLSWWAENLSYIFYPIYYEKVKSLHNINFPNWLFWLGKTLFVVDVSELHMVLLQRSSDESNMTAITAEPATKLLDFNQKLDISLLDNVVGCMLSGIGQEVCHDHVYCLL